MRRRFFDAENWLWTPLGVLGDLVMLSLLWGVCSIPVLTAGSAAAAAYDTAVHVLRRQEDGLLSRFFSTFKRDLKSGVLSTLLWIGLLGAAFLLFLGLRTALPEGEGRTLVLLLCLGLAGFLPLCVLVWVFPTLSRFTFDTRGLNVTALRLALGHILRSAALALLLGGCVWLVLRWVLLVIALPGLAFYLSSFLIEPVFVLYEKQENPPEE